MYNCFALIRSGLRASSLFSLLARNHGGLKTLRSISTVPTISESSGETSSTDSESDQNQICDKVDTIRRPNNIPKGSTSDIIKAIRDLRRKSRWSYVKLLRPNGISNKEFSEIVFALRNDRNLALRFFDWTQKKSLCKHNTRSYATIIHILACKRCTSEALHILCQAIRVSGSDDLKSDLKPLKVFKTLVKTYRQYNSVPIVFNLLIEACLKSKKVEPAMQIFNMLLSRGHYFDFGTCNSLLQKVSRFVGAEKGYELYKTIFKVKNSKVKRKTEIFNTLMVAFYQDGAFERVKDIWDELIKSKLKPNCFSFCILMAMYCDDGKMDKAEEFWEVMRTKKIEFDIVAYNTIIGGFCQCGEMEKADKYFWEMRLQGIESSSTTYEHLLKGYCKMGNLDSAVLIYEEIKRSGFIPEALTMDTLIQGLCHGSRVSEAFEILRCATESNRYCPVRKSFEVLIVCMCRVGNMKEALNVQAKMVAGGFGPTREIYDAFISGYEEQENVEMATKLRKEMLEIGL